MFQHRHIPFEQTKKLQTHLENVLSSYQKWTSRKWAHLTQSGSQQWYENIYFAPKVLLSHDTTADPIFNFGNQVALDLFEVSFNELIKMPSRLSAEPLLQEEREKLIQRVKEHGYTDHYQGIRISSSGKRFYIPKATVWNVLDEQNHLVGQAASFEHWTFLD